MNSVFDFRKRFPSFGSYSFYDDEDIDVEDEIVDATDPSAVSKPEVSSSPWTKPGGITSKFGSSYYGSYYSGRYTGSYYDRYQSSFSSLKLGASVSGEKFTDSAELMKKACKETRDMIVIMDFPFNVSIVFSSISADLISSGDRFIFLETNILDNPNYKDDEKVNIICSLGVHEACHLRYTSREVLNNFYDRLACIGTKGEGEVDECSVKKTNIKFIKLIANLIEDMRVENKLLEDRPGYSDLLQTEKNYRFTQFTSKKVGIRNSTAEEFFDVLVKLIRFPDEVDPEKVEKFSEIYKKIKETMRPLPNSTKESCIAALNIFNIVIDHIKDFTGLELDDDQISNLLNEYSDSVILTNCTEYANYGFDSTRTAIDVASASAGKTSKSVTKTIVSKLITGDAFSGSSSATFFMKMTGDAAAYNKEARLVSRYVPAMKKIVFGSDKNYDFNIHGCRSGLLDTNKLAEAYQGVPQVYVRKGEVRTNKIALCIVIDESGSMGFGSERDVVARQSAILVNEALKDCPGVDLYIYGHSADQNFRGSTEIYIYREGKVFTPKYALSQSTARRENRDGLALFEIATRLRSLTDQKGIMVVLSDGNPCAFEYYGRCADTDVKNNVEKIERMGIQVIQGTIGPVHNVDYMFPRNIDLRDSVSSLPIELSKVVKKLIVDNKKTTIN